MQDDSIVMQDDSIVMQDDSIVMQDDSIVMQDDSIVMQDDSIVMQDDSIVMQDDSIVMPATCANAVSECSIQSYIFIQTTCHASGSSHRQSIFGTLIYNHTRPMASSLQNCFLHPLSGGEDSHCERDGTFHYLLGQFLKILSVPGRPGGSIKMMQRPNPSLQSHAHAPKLLFPQCFASSECKKVSQDASILSFNLRRSIKY